MAWIATRARLNDCDLSERAFGVIDIVLEAPPKCCKCAFAAVARLLRAVTVVGLTDSDDEHSQIDLVI